MSNNLVRQIVKAGGSFFVGASIAIGTLCPIVLNSSRALAESTVSGISTGAANELATLNLQGQTVTGIAFTPDENWVMIFNKGKSAVPSNNFPQDVVDEIKSIYQQNYPINSITFTPTGEWVIIYGGNGIKQSENFPQDVLDKLVDINQQNLTINKIAFTPDGEWVIIYNNGNSAVPSNNFPQDVVDEIQTINQTQSITSIAFTPNGKWIIITNNGSNAYWSGNFPQDVVNEIKSLFPDPNNRFYNHDLIDIAFTPSNGWALLYYPSQAELCLVESATLGGNYCGL